MDQIKTGLFIAEQRKKLGLTQAQLANIISVSDRTISKWERGVGLPDVTLMLPLCEALHISVNDLLCGEKITEDNIQEKTDENVIKIVKAYKKRNNHIFRLVITNFYLVSLIVAVVLSNRIVSERFSRAGLSLSSYFDVHIRGAQESDTAMFFVYENIPRYKDWFTEQFKHLDFPVCMLLVDKSGTVIAGTDVDPSSKDYQECYERAMSEIDGIPGFQWSMAGGNEYMFLSAFTTPQGETYVLSAYSSHNPLSAAVRSEFFLFAFMVSSVCFVCIIYLYARVDRSRLSAGLSNKETDEKNRI